MSAVDEALGLPPLPPLTTRQRDGIAARLVELLAIAIEQEDGELVDDELAGPVQTARIGLVSDLLDYDLDDLAQAVTDRLHDRDRDRRAALTERPTP